MIHRHDVARLAGLLALLALTAALVVRAARPPAPLEPTAPDSVFSAGRAMRHVQAIARRPHPTGSLEHARVQLYLIDELRKAGLEVHVQETVGIGTRYRVAGTVQNVVARLRGTANTGRAVLLASHYDSQGAGPGAGDAASGVATLLETARALRRGTPPAHDVIVLLTDAEESGLLGAAAFVREHPWAKDVEAVLNFEARGTGGRAFMFETSAGNLDVVQALQDVPGVSATSLMVMVYRILPNDTDLSELMALGKPSLNFAFIDGVERYHTALDDVAHLDPGSVQHHGTQALAMARSLAGGTLPRPRSGDAVFFDVPFLGLVVYPEAAAWPIALLALALVALLWIRLAASHALRPGAVLRGTAALLGAIVAAAAAAALCGIVLDRFGDGAATWRRTSWLAVIMWAVAVGTSVLHFARRGTGRDAAHAGALLAAALLALAATAFARGASHLLAWPTVFAAAAALVAQGWPERKANAVARWVATVAILVLLVPLVYLLGVALGIELPGAIAGGVFTALAVVLLAPHLESLAGARPLVLPLGALAVAAFVTIVAALSARPDAHYPDRRNVTHDTLVTDPASLPTLTVEGDVAIDGRRVVAARVRAPAGTWIVQLRSPQRIGTMAIAGQRPDTTRFRRRPDGWELGFVAPPDTGFTVHLVPPPGPVDLRLVAIRPGVPDAVREAAGRGPLESPSQLGDVTRVSRNVRLP